MLGHPWCQLDMLFTPLPPHRRCARDRGPAYVAYFLAVSFFIGGPLFLSQLPITIAFYDLNSCSGSILSSVDPTGRCAYIYIVHSNPELKFRQISCYNLLIMMMIDAPP